MIQEMDSRLTEWANWLKSIPGISLDYPHETVEQKIGFGTRQTAPENLQAEEIDRLLCEMKKHSGALYWAIIVRYLWNNSWRQGAGWLYTSVYKFQQRVSSAHEWLIKRTNDSHNLSQTSGQPYRQQNKGGKIFLRRKASG